MSIQMIHENIHDERYELETIRDIPMSTMSAKGKQRYLNVHAQRSQLRKVVTKYAANKDNSSNNSTDRRRGKAYSNYLLRLPKRWCDGLGFENHDEFIITIVSYDPVVVQLRKLEGANA